MFNLNLSKYCSVWLHSSSGTHLGRSIEKATDNIHSIGVVKPVYRIPTFPLTAKVDTQGHTFKIL